MHELIILFMAMLLSVYLVYFYAKMKKKGIDFYGKPPINRLLYKFGKIANFSCWGFLVYKAYYGVMPAYNTPEYLAWIATLLVAIGLAFTFAAFKYLGETTKFGLPEEKTRLKIDGIYKYSRNPFYLGFAILNVASMLYYPLPLNLFLGVGGILVHYKIALAEEVFLEKSFGQEYLDYKKKVRRYI